MGLDGVVAGWWDVLRVGGTYGGCGNRGYMGWWLDGGMFSALEVPMRDGGSGG